MLRAELAAEKSVRQVVIDEVQKVPQLLDEAHWLHENRGVHFALCGSSARKVKRGQANLLGGRAVRYELHGLTATEIGRDFNLNRMLNHGYLPRLYLSNTPQRLLNSYVADYLKEEVQLLSHFSSEQWEACILDFGPIGEMGMISKVNRKSEARNRKSNEGRVSSEKSFVPRHSSLDTGKQLV